jgi:hypothetical protein
LLLLLMLLLLMLLLMLLLLMLGKSLLNVWRGSRGGSLPSVRASVRSVFMINPVTEQSKPRTMEPPVSTEIIILLLVS